MLYLLVTPNSYNQFFISPVFGSLKVSLYQNLGDSFFKIVVCTSDQSSGKLPVKDFIFSKVVGLYFLTHKYKHKSTDCLNVNISK